jgi:hypothetical protein
MREDFKAKWVAALRSGEYEQGQGYLRKDGAFCCLGVGCEILRKDFSEEISITVDDDEDYADAVSYNGYAQYLSKGIRTFIGLDGTDEGQLATLNDDEGRTFHEIADYIETEL